MMQQELLKTENSGERFQPFLRSTDLDDEPFDGLHKTVQFSSVTVFMFHAVL